MAVSATPNDGDFPAVIVKEASASTVTSADVFDGPKSVYSITVNNAANAGSFAVVRLYNSLTATTASVPDMKFSVKQALTRDIIINDGIAFATGVSFRCTTGQPDSNAANPGSAVIITSVGS